MKQYILSLSLLCYYTIAETVSDFQGKSFKFTNKQSQIYRVNVGLSEDQMNLGLMSAYGDFNGDKAVDVVITDQENSNIIILYWDTDSNEFVEKTVCQTSCYPQKNIIQGVIPLDYDYDGYLDLLVVLQSTDSYSIGILRQTEVKDGYPVFGIMNEQFSSESFPFVGDFFGDHGTSIMITNETSRYIAYNGQQTKDFKDLVVFDEGCEKIDVVSNALTSKLLTPHFSSFVDVSSDCRADLIITSELGIEYWYTTYVSQTIAEGGEDLLNVQPRFCLLKIDGLPKNTELKSLDFVDVNFDGAIDMVYIYEKEDSQNLVINYNQYLNPTDPSNLCQSNTKDAEKAKSYPYSTFGTNDSTTLIKPLMYKDQPVKLFDYSTLNLQSALAPFIRFGDYLATGYPGAFIIIQNETTSKPNIFYYENVPITQDCQLTSRMCRQLEFNNDPGSHFYLITEIEAINVAFFDYGENGRLDFLVNTISKDEQQNPRYNIAAFYNYISLDAFFIKALGINGQCAADEESQIKCQGSLYYGATYQFRVTDISGTYKPAAGVQLYQSAYAPLQLPYAYMGLGRTNNYIENFYLGIPLLNGQIRQWTPIIPNSQLIASPYKDVAKDWTLSIFIEPTEAILVVVIVTVLILIILGCIIIWKHIKEKEDDKKNQEQFFQMFR